MTSEMVWIGVAFAAAAAVQGSTGFGFGLVSVGLLSLVLPIETAAGLNVVPALAVNLLLLWRLRAHLAWSDLRWMAGAIALATPLGVAGFHLLDPRGMNGILAGVLAATILQSLRGGVVPRPWPPVRAGIPLGLLSGLLAGAYGTGGPPAVAFVHSRGYDRHRHVAGVQLLMAIAGVIRLVSFVLRDTLSAEQWRMTAWGAWTVPVGVWAGLRLLRLMSREGLRRVTLAMLGVILISCLRRMWG